MDKGKCRLCLREADLCRSHILPEFLHRPLYAEDGRALAFHPSRIEQTWKIQSGLRERLLCSSCEGLLSKEYEHPVASTWNPGATLAPLQTSRELLLRGLPYKEYKLFHLSLLWRADAASHNQFAAVDLGDRHRERLRNMLLEGDPGTAEAYQVVCSAIEAPGRKGLWGDSIIAPPERVRIEGRRAYEFVFGACSWLYFVTSHKYGLSDFACLKENGEMPIVRLPWKRLEERAKWARTGR